MGPFSEILIQSFQRKGSIFYLLLAVAALVIVAGEAFWRMRKAKSLPSKLSADDVRLEFLWTVVPVFVLICLSSVRIDKLRPKEVPLSSSFIKQNNLVAEFPMGTRLTPPLSSGAGH